MKVFEYAISVITKFANSVDPDDAAHDQPPILDLQCLPLVFEFLKYYRLDETLLLLVFCGPQVLLFALLA